MAGFYNYYLNMIRDNDRTLQSVLDTLSALDLWKYDHGHAVPPITASWRVSHGGLRGKGPLPSSRRHTCRWWWSCIPNIPAVAPAKL